MSKRSRDLGGEAPADLFERVREAAQVEHHAQEERAALGVRRVLVGLVDVRPLRVQEPETAATIPGRSSHLTSSRPVAT